MNKAKALVEFMGIAEGLKRELRHSWLSDGRRESVAEHVWSMSLLALLLFDEIDIEVDQLRVLKMIIIHDLVEIYAGDMPSFIAMKGRQKEKEEKEENALKKLLEKLNNKKLAREIDLLWNEFEAGETNESKLAQACDKAEVIIQHNNADISTFSQGDYDINPYYKDYLFDFDKFLKELKNQIDIDTMKKIEKEGDIEKVSDEHKSRWIAIKNEEEG
jgi:putative hydrolase of HD superfamily